VLRWPALIDVWFRPIDPRVSVPCVVVEGRRRFGDGSLECGYAGGLPSLEEIRNRLFSSFGSSRAFPAASCRTRSSLRSTYFPGEMRLKQVWYRANSEVDRRLRR